MKEYTRIAFSDIPTKVPDGPGLYEIHALAGTAMKVGISSNLRRRLIQHGESKQQYLLCPDGNWSDPDKVMSKRSVLAKHLYFYSAEGYDLKLEEERRRFLNERCYILFKVTSSRVEARELEKELEATGRFRFVGRVAAESANDR
jgi:hypothetical protein